MGPVQRKRVLVIVAVVQHAECHKGLEELQGNFVTIAEVEVAAPYNLILQAQKTSAMNGVR
jgi:hypothetical protein